MHTLLYFVVIYLSLGFSYAENVGINETTTGKQVEIRVDEPLDGAILSAGAAITVTGRASIGQISSGINVLYIVDVSTSTESFSTLGQDCDGNDTAGDQGDDSNGDGQVGNTLDCEINGIIALNENLMTLSSVEGGLVIFASSATAADIDPEEGNQVFTSRLDTDNNANNIPDIHEVALSLDSESVGLFTRKTVSGGTNFDAALTSMNNAFLTKPEGRTNIAFFLSDGQSSVFTNNGGALDTAIQAGYIVNTFSVGSGSTGCADGADLGVIAERTGGVCAEVLDPSQLGQALLDSRPAGIVRIEVSVNDNEPVLATIDPLGSWSANIPEGTTTAGLNHIKTTVFVDDSTTASVNISVNDGGDIAVFEASSLVLTIPVVATADASEIASTYSTFKVSGSEPLTFDLLDSGLTLSGGPVSGVLDSQSGAIRIPIVEVGEDLYQATLIPEVARSTAQRYRVTDISLLSVLTGRVIDANDSTSTVEGTPIVGATISLVGTTISAISDAQGNFRLAGDTSGVEQVILDIDGSTATLAPDGSPYAGFREAIDLGVGERMEVDRAFFMPRVDRSSLTVIDPSTSTQVDNIALGMSVVVPPNTAKNADGSNFTGALSISEVPIGREPAEMPANLGPCQLVTLQPVGVNFTTPVPISFPNAANLAPGSETDIWSLDPDRGQFDVVGRGQVSEDGSTINTISGGVRQTDWHFTLPRAANWVTNLLENNAFNFDWKKSGSCGVGSSSGIQNGCLSVAHTLTPYRSFDSSQSLRFIYHSESASPHPIIHTGTDIDSSTPIPEAFSLTLEQVGGESMSQQIFVGAGRESLRQAIQFDASDMQTGLYPYRLKASSHYGECNIGTFIDDLVLVNNEKQSPFGSGWTLDGLQKLHFQNEDDKVILTEGDGSIKVFDLSQGETTQSNIAIFIDASANISAADFSAQVNGLADALVNPNIVPQDGSTSISVMQFTSSSQGRIEIPLTLVTSAAAAQVGADMIRNITRVQTGDSLLLAFNETLAELNANVGAQRLLISLAGEASFIREVLNVSPVFLNHVDSVSILISAIEVDSDLLNQSTPRVSVNVIGSFDQFSQTIGPKLHAVTTGFESAQSAPLGEFSEIIANSDASFTRIMPNGTRVQFDAQGLQTEVSDRNGNTTTFTYDAAQHLTNITDPKGLVTTLTYSENYLTQVENPAGRVTHFEHDDQGNLTRIVDPDASDRLFSYNEHSLLSAQTDKLGRVTEYSYDSSGRLVQADWPDGSTRQLSSSQTQTLVSEASATTQSAPAPSVAAELLTSSFTDGNGQVTRFKTDRFGAVTESTDALARVTRSARNTDGLIINMTRANNDSNTLSYDRRGHVLSIHNQSIDALTKFTYTPVFGNVTSITDPLGNRASIDYDMNGNPILLTDIAGTMTQIVYDDPNCPGKATQITHAVGQAEQNTISFSYDVACNLRQTTDALERVSTLSYDDAGNIIQRINAKGQITRFSYDVLNRLVKQIDASNNQINPDCGTRGVTCTEYDAASNIVSIRDGNNNITRFEYDSRNRLTRKVDPLAKAESFSYDANGNLIASVDRNNQHIQFDYDAVNRLIKKTWLPDSTEQVITEYSYGNTDQLLSINKPDSVLTFSYDLLSRLSTVATTGSTHQPDTSISYSYDKNSNRLSMQSLVGQTDYAYDALNRLTRLTDPFAQTSQFSYDRLSRRTGLQHANGVLSSYRYDAASQLLDLTHQGRDGRVSDFAYTYDALGNRSEVDHTHLGFLLQQDFGYDSLNQIIQAAHPLPSEIPETFNYDPLGNRLQQENQANTTQIGSGNRLLENDNFCFTYDDNGNLSSKQRKQGGVCTGSLTIYQYDPENQLTAVRRNNELIARYRYDGLGRRIEKNVEGVISRYIYDGEDILLEYDQNNTLVAYFTHGPGIDEPLIMLRDINANGAIEESEHFFYHTDGLGSISELTGSEGETVQTYVYDTFGNITTVCGGALFIERDEVSQALADPQTCIINPYSYTGREFDAETGLYYYRARYYDAQMGRFMQEDPLGFAAGDMNLYRYVGNNGVNFVDPFGLESASDKGWKMLEDQRKEREKKYRRVWKSPIILSDSDESTELNRAKKNKRGWDIVAGSAPGLTLLSPSKGGSILKGGGQAFKIIRSLKGAPLDSEKKAIAREGGNFLGKVIQWWDDCDQ